MDLAACRRERFDAAFIMRACTAPSSFFIVCHDGVSCLAFACAFVWVGGSVSACVLQFCACSWSVIVVVDATLPKRSCGVSARCQHVRAIRLGEGAPEK